MTARRKAEEAIRRWGCELGLPQKLLAIRVKQLPSTISHILNDPGWTASAQVYQTICDAVEAEAYTRITSIPMKIVSLCQSSSVSFEDANAPVIEAVRSSLADLYHGKPLQLPEGITGALIQVGEKLSGIMIIAISVDTDAETRLALAHELEHIRTEVIAGISRDITIPRSSF